ncbi:ACP S-malonyltransferase [Kovacikia minuta CCNUW1]|uniref:ACP S-malonyltransferase n=1 Tax=Kovacikia minuta TaxID=2931930 RepID=UPI001CCFD486|nr:ACP S-malonyltransferase [Kovacikia minuta]UBF27767.1 ACP S-malonyltransferase [Kovacikia minuta CCNUW1]
MIILVDHHLEGYIVLLQGALANEGWLDLLPIHFVLLEEAGLAINSSDRVVWQFAQQRQMILLTANRKMKGKDSLEQTIREENTSISLPVVTIGRVDRLSNREYREQCAARLVEIILYPETCIGVGRVFIP